MEDKKVTMKTDKCMYEFNTALAVNTEFIILQRSLILKHKVPAWRKCSAKTHPPNQLPVTWSHGKLRIFEVDYLPFILKLTALYDTFGASFLV